MRKNKNQKREDKLRGDEHNSFVIEEEDNPVQDGMCSTKDIARQADVINRKTEKRKLDREEKEA